MTVVNLELVVVQASVWDGRIRPVRFQPDGKDLLNLDRIVIPLSDDGVVGLHLRLPGTSFDVVHRVINPAPYLGAGDSLTIEPGRWSLHPNPYTSFDPLEKIQTV